MLYIVWVINIRIIRRNNIRIRNMIRKGRNVDIYIINSLNAI